MEAPLLHEKLPNTHHFVKRKANRKTNARSNIAILFGERETQKNATTLVLQIFVRNKQQLLCSGFHA